LSQTKKGGMSTWGTWDVISNEQISIHCVERNLSLTELYAADEAFGTGSMGELTPVVEVDGRVLQNRRGSNVTQQLMKAFHRLASRYSTPI
jgi:branched-chain amino acid aminotransferase